MATETPKLGTTPNEPDVEELRDIATAYASASDDDWETPDDVPADCVLPCETPADCETPREAPKLCELESDSPCVRDCESPEVSDDPVVLDSELPCANESDKPADFDNVAPCANESDVDIPAVCDTPIPWPVDMLCVLDNDAASDRLCPCELPSDVPLVTVCDRPAAMDDDVPAVALEPPVRELEKPDVVELPAVSVSPLDEFALPPKPNGAPDTPEPDWLELPRDVESPAEPDVPTACDRLVPLLADEPSVRVVEAPNASEDDDDSLVPVETPAVSVRPSEMPCDSDTDCDALVPCDKLWPWPADNVWDSPADSDVEFPCVCVAD